MRSLLLLVFIPLMSYSGSLETCYRVFVLFLPVAESCVAYKQEGEKLTISSWVKTIVIGKIVHRVHNWGKSELEGFKPVYFELFQREGEYERDHYYHFNRKGVDYSIILFNDDEEREEIKRGFYESSVFLYDPFSASLALYLDTPNTRGGYIQLFYDEKIQNISYRTTGEEVIKVNGIEYSTWKVVLIPEIETKGTLKPRGKWLIWIDRVSLIPVRFEIKFNIGSAKVYLTSVRGDRKLLRTLKVLKRKM